MWQNHINSNMTCVWFEMCWQTALFWPIKILLRTAKTKSNSTTIIIVSKQHRMEGTTAPSKLHGIILPTHLVVIFFSFFCYFCPSYTLVVCLSVTWPMAVENGIFFGKFLCVCVLSSIFDDYCALLFHMGRHYVSLYPFRAVACSVFRLLHTVHTSTIIIIGSFHLHPLIFIVSFNLIVCSTYFTSKHIRYTFNIWQAPHRHTGAHTHT